MAGKPELTREPDLLWVAAEEIRKRAKNRVSYYEGGKFWCPYQCGHQNPNPFEGLPVKAGIQFMDSRCEKCGEMVHYKVERGLSSIARDQAIGTAATDAVVQPKKVPR